METIIGHGRRDPDNELLDLFVDFYEKQDIVQRQTTKPFIHQYGHSELHCIDAIGKNCGANVSLIAQKLSITRGAASKIVKKLLARGDVSSYCNLGNKKEIYYALTAQGRKVFLAHAERHAVWLERDLRFLRTVSREDKEVVREFLVRFNRYLQERIADAT